MFGFFGFDDAREIYGYLADEMGVKIIDLNLGQAGTLENDYHKLEVSANTEKELYKFIYFVENAADGLRGWEEDFSEED